MANYISNAPLWVIILFIVSFLYSIALIAKPAKQAALNAGMTPAKSRNIQFGIFGFYVLYLAYVSILALKGVFYINPIPPKVMVFAAVPLTIILFAIIGNTKLFKKLLGSITLESLVAIHKFRLVGVFFIVLYCYHLLPAGLAFSAETGDIVTALFAWPVAKWVSQERSWSIKAVYIWNIFGILDIVNVLVIVGIAVRNTLINGTDGGLTELTLFPFAWFPAFAPATILFLHAAVFRKLRQIKTSTALTSQV
jgi:hypothetical protein